MDEKGQESPALPRFDTRTEEIPKNGKKRGARKEFHVRETGVGNDHARGLNRKVTSQALDVRGPYRTILAVRPNS